MQQLTTPRDRTELEQRLRAYRIEGRKTFGTYVSLQTARRIADAQRRLQECGHQDRPVSRV